MDLRKEIYFYANLAAFPATGALNLLYVDKSTGLIYTWNGSSYAAAGSGGLKYMGTWNANTNSPSIASGIGNPGEYYIVSVAGTTNIDGISDWGINDWIIFGGSAWQKIDNSETTVATIYTANGTVTGNRTIDLNGNTLKFSNGIVEFDQGSSNSGEIRLYEDSDFGTNKVSLRAPQAMASDVTFFFPPNNGTNGYVLSTNGAGATSWIAASGGLTYFTEAENTSAPNATVYVDSLTAAASSTNADVAIRPKGNGALLTAIPDNTATGGNKRGQYAVDLNFYRTGANQVASGIYAFLAGAGGIASGQSAVAFGATASGTNSTALQSSTASNTHAFAHGSRCTSSGSGSVAFGGYVYVDTIASGDNSTAINGANQATANFAFAAGGYYNVANGYMSYAFGAQGHTFGIAGRMVKNYSFNNVAGECQKSIFNLGVRTTGNTATTVTVGGNAAGTDNQVILSNQSAYGFTGTIVGKQSGSTNAAMWKVEGLIARGANAASTVLTTSTVTLVSNAPGWGTPTLAADTTNGGLQVQVIGATSTNIQWTAVIETTEVIYA